MLDVRNLVYRYPTGQRPAVDDISFTIAEGEIFGFLGPSGAGKTTTQSILIRLLTGYSGDVSVFGQPLSSYGQEYFERVGIGFELPNHYSKLTARQNLEFFASLYSGPTEDPADLLEQVGLAEHADVQVGRYSKGMKMRLSFCRAVLSRPRLLFLDEPTSGLDPVNARRLKDLIRTRRDDGTTIFLTTHNMHDADELCDRVAFIVDGRIVASASPRELKLQHGRRAVRVEYRDGGRLTQAEFPMDGLGENAEYLNLIRTGQVETIHSQETTLEDVFVAVTGRGLS